MAELINVRVSNQLWRPGIPAGGTVGQIVTKSATGDYETIWSSPNIHTTSTPASAGSTGTTGTITWDADYIYVCVATDTWKRIAIATW